MTASSFIGWARHDLVTRAGFRQLREEFPELWGKARVFDAALVTTCRGRYRVPGLVVTACASGLALLSAGTQPPVWLAAAALALTSVAVLAVASTSTVMLCFRVADEVPMGELMGELARVNALIPSPGAVDAFEYYGALVLVFEKPLPSAKRDRLISLRQSSPLGRMVTDIWVVELDAGTIYALDVPGTVRGFIEPLQDALGKRADPPPLAEPAAVFGQRGSHVGVAWATLGLMAVMTIIHVLVHTEHAESTSLRMLRAGVENTKLVARGEWWRTMTSMYLHYDWDHIGWNLVIFFELSRGVEHLFGTGWTMALFVITGWLANLFSMMVVGEMASAAGASGAVAGSAGLLVGVLLLRGRSLSMRYRSHLFIAMCLMSLNIWRGFSNNPANAGGNWAHLGGFLSGIAVGLFLPFREEGKPVPWRGPLWGAAALGVSLLAFVMTAAVSWSWQPDAFTPFTSGAVRATIEVPESWWSEEHGATSTSPGVAMVANHVGGRVTLMHGEEDIAGIFEWPLHELRDLIYGKLRKTSASGESTHWRNAYDFQAVDVEMLDLKPEFSTLAGGKALRVTYRVTESSMRRQYHLFEEHTIKTTDVEDYFLPLKDGYLLASFRCEDRDRDYYRPIFSRLRNTLKTQDPPADWIAPQAGARESGTY